MVTEAHIWKGNICRGATTNGLIAGCFVFFWDFLLLWRAISHVAKTLLMAMFKDAYHVMSTSTPGAFVEYLSLSLSLFPLSLH